MPNKEKREIRLWEPFLVGISAAIGLLAGYNMNFDNHDSSLLSFKEQTSVQGLTAGDGRIEEIIRFVETKYVDSINVDEMTINLIDDMLSKLDPHSSYITPAEYSEYNEKMKGVYRGIGIETLKLRDTFYISRLLEGGPAEAAGFRIGDALLTIDGDSVAGKEMPFDKVRDMLKDVSKEQLVISALGVDESVSRDVNVDIKEIQVASADICYMLDDKTAYLKLSRFSGNTYEQFIESIEKIKEGKTELNLILDLRGNPGGYLPQAIKILSQLFEKKDQLLTYTEGLNQKRREYRSTGNAFYKIAKVAVLIDGDSASGSEILAGAIQDWDRGIVIGRTSYGKGLVQEIYPLNNGGALRLTIAKYYTPVGRLIQKSYASDNNQFQADESIFETKMLSRKMAGGTGIVPDAELSENDSEKCYNYHYYSDHYVLDKMLQLNRSELRRKDLLQRDYDAYLQASFGESPELLKGNCDSDISKELYSSYKRMVLSKNDYARFSNINDQYISAALEFIDDSRPTLALLSKEE